jgi:hypothetical protein
MAILNRLSIEDAQELSGTRGTQEFRKGKKLSPAELGNLVYDFTKRRPYKYAPRSNEHDMSTALWYVNTTVTTPAEQKFMGQFYADMKKQHPKKSQEQLGVMMQHMMKSAHFGQYGNKGLHNSNLTQQQNKHLDEVRVIWARKNKRRVDRTAENAILNAFLKTPGAGSIGEAMKKIMKWNRSTSGGKYFFDPPNSWSNARKQELGYKYTRIGWIPNNFPNPPDPSVAPVIHPAALEHRRKAAAALEVKRKAAAAKRRARRIAASRRRPPKPPKPPKPKPPKSVVTPRKSQRAAQAGRSARRRRKPTQPAAVPLPITPPRVGAPVAVRGRVRPRARPPRARRPVPRRAPGVKHVAPHLRLIASQQHHFKGVYRHNNITPKLNLRTLGPGHFVVRSQHLTAGVRQQIKNLLRRAPKNLWVNGHKHSRKQALGVIMRLLEQNHAVDIQLAKI